MCRWAVSGTVLAGALALGAAAEDGADIVTVTGARTGAAPASVLTLDREALRASGAEDLAQALAYLPVQAGAEFNTDSATQNDTSGTTNVNLRGIGLDATLVLLDGTRMTVSSVAADDGATFVDLNALVPAIAIEAVDVFADGASALYGSDALAGVVNVRTRAGFEGFDIEGERRVLTEYGEDGSDWAASAIWGVTGARGRVAAAVEWRERQSLEGVDVPFVAGTGVSSLGQPGSYLVTGPDGPVRIIDEDCAAGGGIPTPSGDPIAGLGTPGFCGLDFGQAFSVVNNENRFLAWADGAWELGWARAGAQVTFADNAIERGNSPSLPHLGFPTIPAANPGNIYGEDVTWFGRPLGASAGSARRTFDHETARVRLSLNGDADWAGRAVAWEGVAAYSRNAVTTTITDALVDRFDAALNGLGGPNCPDGSAPGTNGCQWFNPFGTGGLITDAGDPRFNDPALVEYVTGLDVRTGETDLLTLDVGAVVADVFAAPGGSATLAFGAQGRRETRATDHGEDFNAENYLFIIGGPDSAGERDSWGAYAELAVPFSASFDAQVAGRVDQYGDETAFSPRVAARWAVNDVLTLDGAISRAFRAPSLFEETSSTTTLENFVIDGAALFRAVQTQGADDLDTETATTFTLGLEAARGPFTVRLDAWRYDIDDLIVEENAQAIVAADLADDGVLNDPRVELDDSGEVRRVIANFVNAPSVETQGLDLTARADGLTLWGGTAALSGVLSYLDQYDLTEPETGATVDAAGRRNADTFARALPRFKANARATWSRDWTGFGSDLAVGLRHIGPYDDDDTGRDVDAWTVVDLDASARLATALGGETRVTLGVQNAFNEDPPFVQTTLGYDTKTHDPRGRIVYLRLVQAF